MIGKDAWDNCSGQFEVGSQHFCLDWFLGYLTTLFQLRHYIMWHETKRSHKRWIKDPERCSPGLFQYYSGILLKRLSQIMTNISHCRRSKRVLPESTSTVLLTRTWSVICLKIYLTTLYRVYINAELQNKYEWQILNEVVVAWFKLVSHQLLGGMDKINMNLSRDISEVWQWKSRAPEDEAGLPTIAPRSAVVWWCNRQLVNWASLSAVRARARGAN